MRNHLWGSGSHFICKRKSRGLQAGCCGSYGKKQGFLRKYSREIQGTTVRIRGFSENTVEEVGELQ